MGHWRFYHKKEKENFLESSTFNRQLRELLWKFCNSRKYFKDFICKMIYHWKLREFLRNIPIENILSHKLWATYIFYDVRIVYNIKHFCFISFLSSERERPIQDRTFFIINIVCIREILQKKKKYITDTPDQTYIIPL